MAIFRKDQYMVADTLNYLPTARRLTTLPTKVTENGDLLICVRDSTFPNLQREKLKIFLFPLPPILQQACFSFRNIMEKFTSDLRIQSQE